jgi:hypothetical protein
MHLFIFPSTSFCIFLQGQKTKMWTVVSISPLGRVLKIWNFKEEGLKKKKLSYYYNMI